VIRYAGIFQINFLAEGEVQPRGVRSGSGSARSAGGDPAMPYNPNMTDKELIEHLAKDDPQKLSIIFLEKIAEDLKAHANDPELVRQKAEELLQLVRASEEIFIFLLQTIQGYARAKAELNRKQNGGETTH
jgi:hypothetical protein